MGKTKAICLNFFFSSFFLTIYFLPFSILLVQFSWKMNSLNKKVVFDSFKTNFNYLLLCFPVWCFCVHNLHKNVCSMPINGIKKNCYFLSAFLWCLFFGESVNYSYMILIFFLCQIPFAPLKIIMKLACRKFFCWVWK